jgi:transposase
VVVFIVRSVRWKVEGSVEYGEKLKVLLVYMNQYGFLPYERLQEFTQDIFGLLLGGGIIEVIHEKCYEHLRDTEQQIKGGLLGSKVIHNEKLTIKAFYFFLFIPQNFEYGLSYCF